MERKELTIGYTQFENIDELPYADKELLQKAIEATAGSYSPYSGFSVGAAVLMDNGEIISAANQENAAYPSGMCAERVTLFYAHSKYPDAKIRALALIACYNGEITPQFTYPCGACRQVLSESQTRSGSPIRIIVGSASKVLVLDSVSALLPFAFDNYPN
ncbi:MAG: cytidine deaminase [Bacteroidales bacterium]|nr:cytidine deaminase [Bacteroidales bacterium]